MAGTEIQAGQIKGVLVLDGKQFNVGLQKAGKNATNFEKGQVKTSSKVSRAWTSAFGKIAAGAGIAFAFKAIIKEGSALEKSLAKVSTLGDISAATMADMEEQVRLLSTELRKAPLDLTEGLYQAISSGAAAGSEAIDLLTESAKFATAGVTNTKVAVDAISNAVNVYGKENLSANRAANLMFRTIKLGKTTAEEFAPQIGRVAAGANALGVSFEEVTAASALLTRTMPTPQAITALEGTMRGLVQASDKFADAGINIFEVLREEGLGGALQKLQDLTGGSTEAIKKIIPETEAFKGVLSLLKNEIGDYNDLLGKMESQTDDVNVAVGKQMDTTASRTEGLKVAFKNLASTLFEDLQPAYDRFLLVATKVLEVSDKLISSNENAVRFTEEQRAAMDALIVAEENGFISKQELMSGSLELAKAFIKENATRDDLAKKAKDAAAAEIIAEEEKNASTKASLAELAKNKKEHEEFLGEQFDIRLKKEQDDEDRAFQREIKRMQEKESRSKGILDEFIETGNKRIEAILREEAIRKGIEIDAINSSIFLAEKKKKLDKKASDDRVAQIDADRAAIDEANTLAQDQAKNIQAFSESVWDTVGQGWANTTANFIANSDEMQDSQQTWAQMADDLWDSMKEKAIATLLSIVGQQLTQAAIVASGWAPAAAFSATATGGATAGAAVAAIAGLFSSIGKFIPSKEVGGPVSEGLTFTHDDEFVLSRMQTGQVSALLTKLNDKIDTLDGGGSAVVIKPKGDIAQKFFQWFNVEVETNKRRAIASGTI